jgi:hypothetical protein
MNMGRMTGERVTAMCRVWDERQEEGLRFMVCGLWFVVCGLWFVVD